MSKFKFFEHRFGFLRSQGFQKCIGTYIMLAQNILSERTQEPTVLSRDCNSPKMFYYPGNSPAPDHKIRVLAPKYFISFCNIHAIKALRQMLICKFFENPKKSWTRGAQIPRPEISGDLREFPGISGVHPLALSKDIIKSRLSQHSSITGGFFLWVF